MKNKNLILGIFILGIVLMSSFAFAGITGYVLRGQALSTEGVTATLQGVDSGIATVVVENTETGSTETVQVAEGEIATTSEGTEVTIQNVRTGSLFRRAGGEISVVPASKASSVAGIATGGNALGDHTHLSDYDISGRNLATFIRNPANTNNVYVELPCYPGTVPIDAGFNLEFNTPTSTDRLPVIQWKHHDYQTYYIGFWDPDGIIITGPNDSWGYVYCAKVEPTLHQFSQDY